MNNLIHESRAKDRDKEGRLISFHLERDGDSILRLKIECPCGDAFEPVGAEFREPVECPSCDALYSVELMKCSSCGEEFSKIRLIGMEQEELRVVKCYITTNGNVMSFDEDGQQIPECQGFILDIAETLKTRCDQDTQWGFTKWKQWAEAADFSWWWEEKHDKDGKDF